MCTAPTCGGNVTPSPRAELQLAQPHPAGPAGTEHCDPHKERRQTPRRKYERTVPPERAGGQARREVWAERGPPHSAAARGHAREGHWSRHTLSSQDEKRGIRHGPVPSAGLQPPGRPEHTHRARVPGTSRGLNLWAAPDPGMPALSLSHRPVVKVGHREGQQG